MLRILLFLLMLMPCLAEAKRLPSMVRLSQTVDNDQNQNTSVDISVATPVHAIFDLGASFSQLKFDENNTGQNTSYRFGLSSNPMRDWVFSADIDYIVVSDQMEIINPSVNVRRYFNRFNVGVDLGYRTIRTDITPALETLLFPGLEEAIDENFWWGLQFQVEPVRNVFIGLSYRQYDYDLRFQFFTRELAPILLGYTLDTINYGASFADYIANFNIVHYWRKYDFGLDYSFIKNKFDATTTHTITPSFGYQLSKRWYFNVSLGVSQGVTENEPDTTGGFLSLGTAFSF